MAKKIYRSMQGKLVDMEKMKNNNELVIAVSGNNGVRMNARGDQLGPGGKIIKKREEIVAAYYENNPKVVSQKKPEPVNNTDENSSKSQTKPIPTRTKK